MDANTMRDQLVARLKTTNYDILNIDDREASDVLTRAELEFTMRRVVGDLNAKRKGFEIDSKRRLDLSTLATSHKVFKRVNTGLGAVGDFVLGTEDNGALRTPDKDRQLESPPVGVPTVETDFGIFCRVPDECLFIIAESASTSKGSLVKNNVPVQVVKYEEYMTGIRDPYFSPYYNKVWRMDSGNWIPASSTSSELSVKHLSGTNASGSGLSLTINTVRSVHLIPGKDWTIEKYTMHYIKQPNRIVVDLVSPNLQQSSELNPAVHDEIVDIAVRLYMSDRMPEQAKYQVAEKEQREDE